MLLISAAAAALVPSGAHVHTSAAKQGHTASTGPAARGDEKKYESTCRTPERPLWVASTEQAALKWFLQNKQRSNIHQLYVSPENKGTALKRLSVLSVVASC